MPRQPVVTYSVPRQDGAAITWPALHEAARQAPANYQAISRLAWPRIQGVPIGELRTLLRSSLGLDPATPVVATGHQVELIHPGVWFKDALLSETARATSLQALRLEVDTDAPRHLEFASPAGRVSFVPAGSAAVPFLDGLGALEADRAASLASDLTRLADAVGHPSLLRAFARAIAPAPTLARSLAAATDRVSMGSLGLSYTPILGTDLWSSQAFLAFAFHLLASPKAFAWSYNLALARFRKARGMQTRQHPWPDLHAESRACEVPFWLDDPARGTRVRPVLTQHDGTWRLTAAGQGFDLSPQLSGLAAADKLAAFLGAAGLRVAPRAVTLTLFMRLIACDQFIHGIGGGVYDQVTDQVFEGFLGVAPPKFTVATATLYLPGFSLPPDFAAMARQRRGLRHGLSLPQKRKWAKAVADAPRGSPERAQLFAALHDRLRSLAGADLAALDARVASENEQWRWCRNYYTREASFLLQSPDRLKSLLALARLPG